MTRLRSLRRRAKSHRAVVITCKSCGTQIIAKAHKNPHHPAEDYIFLPWTDLEGKCLMFQDLETNEELIAGDPCDDCRQPSAGIRITVKAISKNWTSISCVCAGCQNQWANGEKEAA